MSDRDIREDINLARLALARMWPVDPAKKAEVVAMLAELALSKDVRPRQRITAARVLIQADAVSLNALETTMKAKDHDEYRAELAAMMERIDALHAEGAPPGPRIIIPPSDTRWESPEKPE